MLEVWQSLIAFLSEPAPVWALIAVLLLAIIFRYTRDTNA